MQTIPNTNWYLISQDEDSEIQGSVPITAPFRIGRREGFSLCLSSRNVSGLHAEILEEDDGQLWIYDLNSTNGTFVNDQKIREKTVLKDEDIVRFANRSFRVIGNSSARDFVATIDGSGILQPPESPKDRFLRLLDGDVVPFFQPIFRITNHTKELVGYEVLGRSRMFGLRTPDEMFAAALDLEMEAELSRVLRNRGVEAANQVIPDSQMLFLNTHPAEFECGSLIESLNDIREEFPERTMALELPESMLNSPDTFFELRRKLSNLDIKLALHDFGAGHIRLSELSELSPDVVKFDGALLQDISNATAKRQRLVSALAKMVRELGIIPMAEYIESPDDHESLVKLGLVYSQGFYYGRPADVKNVDATSFESSRAPEPGAISAMEKNVDRLEDLVSKDLGDKPIAKPSQPAAKPTKPVEKKSSIEPTGDKPTVHADSVAWLLKQPADYYTVQLTLLGTREAAEKVVAEQNQPGKYAIYLKQGKARRWYVVAYGAFEDRETAKAATQKLCSGLGISPWVRRFSAVQEEVHALEKQDAEANL